MSYPARSASTPFPLARVLIILLVAIATFLPGYAAAKTGVPRAYAGIVVDAKSGKVLYESSADSLRYPASITKVMTLYVLFQELSAGNLKLSDRLTVSKHAASARPTKLGLKAGATITVEDAIKSLVTISANDMAVVIGEAISGTEDKFAQRMTATAKALGMTHTNYANASGWPDSRQVTTVRDQARLAVAIYQHFPQYYTFFQTRSFTYGKRTYNSHVPLLGVAGVEGMKTGYINASGYNLMTVTRKDNKHLVIIGFGFNSIKERNSKVSAQLSKYLSQARSGDYVQTAMIPAPGPVGRAAIAVASAPVVPLPYPDFRDDDDAVAEIAPTDEGDDIVEATQQGDDAVVLASAKAPMPEQRPVDLGMQPALSAANALAAPPAEGQQVDVIGAWLSDNYKLGAPPAPLGQTRPSAPLVPPVGIGDRGQPVDLMTSGAIGEAAPALVADQQEPPALAIASNKGEALPSGWVVQIGAAPSETGANSLLSDASSRINGLSDFKAFVERFEKNGQTYYRARFGGFGGRDDATGMCNQLKKANMSCLAMQS